VTGSYILALVGAVAMGMFKTLIKPKISERPDANKKMSIPVEIPFTNKLINTSI
jgi:hypothetical protein